jgi:AAA+ superfamily predicted ATPase
MMNLLRHGSHGPPGSGKTSTAETIAAYTRRPLYSLTCGDIGATPTDMENKLFEHTQRANTWGCILLLDEADVFLVQRDMQDMQRNAMVSGKYHGIGTELSELFSLAVLLVIRSLYSSIQGNLFS